MGGAATGNLLGGYGASPAVPNDPFSSTFSNNTTTNPNSLLDLIVAPAASTPALDPFAVMSAVPNQSISNNMNNMNNMNNINNNPTMQTHMHMHNIHMPVPTPSGSDNMVMNSLSSGMTNMSFAAAGSSSSMPPSHNNKGPMMALNEDRFSALDALTSSTQPPNALDAKNAENRLLGFTTTASTLSSNQETNYSSAYNNNSNNNNNNNNNMMYSVSNNMIASGAGRVSKAYGDSGDTDEDNPWVMGGTTGSGQGLVPVGPEPSAPPPPPPPPN